MKMSEFNWSILGFLLSRFSKYIPTWFGVRFFFLKASNIAMMASAAHAKLVASEWKTADQIWWSQPWWMKRSYLVGLVVSIARNKLNPSRKTRFIENLLKSKILILPSTKTLKKLKKSYRRNVTAKVFTFQANENNSTDSAW